MKSYGVITRSYGGITRSYKREREVITREREGVGTIGLDWLLGVVLIGWRGGERKAASLIHLAWPSPPSSPHSSLPQSLSSPHSTSI